MADKRSAAKTGSGEWRTEDPPRGQTGANGPRQTLPATPSSVPAIRHELDHILDSLQIAPERADDIRLALTEACTNAVQHAYPDASPPGQMSIAIDVSSEGLIVSVLDAGRGIDEPSPHPGLGVGLPVIQALADTVTIENLQPGTRVGMTFHL